MKLLQRLTIGLLIVTSFNVAAQTSQDTKSDSYRMKSFIDVLMKKMTLEEKIGQLNLPGAGDITTGQASSSDIAKKIEQGKVGGLFNIKTVAKIKRSRGQSAARLARRSREDGSHRVFIQGPG